LSSNKAIVSGLAGRYAVALFDLGQDEGKLEAIEGDFELLSALLDDGGDFALLVSSLVLGAEAQTRAVKAVAATLELSTEVSNFLGVLATNRRLKNLAACISSFSILLADHRGEVTADVVSAGPLSDDQVEALRGELKAIVGQDVIFETRVDESLLGGLVVKVGSRMIDSSVKAKLENLQISMKGI
jgi:F-type H+-transporting ATPase subunit delta